jgi:microcystin-dependent protein
MLASVSSRKVIVLKRAPFLGAAASLVLSGCGGHHVMRALPGVAQSSQREPQKFSGPADPIPDSVLRSPIVGEARRFDGAVAPTGWLLLQTKTLNIADYRMLFNVLGASAGGDGKTTFKLPGPPQGWIIAVAGTFSSSPQVLARMGRHTTLQDSLGPGARLTVRVPSPRSAHVLEQRTATLREQQRFAASAPKPGPSRSAPVSPEFRARAELARNDDRTSVLALLSAENRSRVLGLLDAVLAGSISMYEATLRTAASLSAQEARAALDVFDATQRAFGGSPAGHADPQLEAGRYVVSVAFSAEQLYRLGTMQGNA